MAPATFIWTGGGSTNNWSDPKNWQGGAAPTGSATTLDDLVFPSSALQKITNNNLTGVNGNLPTFNSLSISGSGYTIGGTSPVVLGSPTSQGGGQIIVSASQTDVITLNLQLGGASGSKQFFTVNQGAVLTISGQISGTTGSELSKEGTGTLVLSGDNSGFTGPVLIDNSSGIVEITSPTALGNGTNTTTVGTNAQLQVKDLTAAVKEGLILNGSGIANSGAIENVSGNNVWSGSVELDSDAAVGALAGRLTIAGKITDLGAGHGLSKEGTGEVVLSAANDYRGVTTVDNGILTAANALALGPGDDQPSTGVLVTQTTTLSGTLRVSDPTGVGFTIANKFLTLNGHGFNNLGALDLVKGNIVWTGDVILGSPAPNGAAVTINAETQDPFYSVTITGVVSSPNGAYQLNKTGPGGLIFTRANTYTGFTDIKGGILEIRDSQGLGSTFAGTQVETGATLELNAQDTPDSVTNTTHSLNVSEPLNLRGTGTGSIGALLSASGVNTYSGAITLSNAFGPTLNGLSGSDGIGVLADPNPSNSSSYFANDFSLTVTGPISDKNDTLHIYAQIPVQEHVLLATLEKDGTGQLILPNANTFMGGTEIKAGWITIEDSGSLGVPPPFLGPTASPPVKVDQGGSLHLKAKSPTSSIVLNRDFQLTGTGFSSPFGQINQEGAIENIEGVNTITGDITLLGRAGVGVEKIFGTSQLTLTGSFAFPPQKVAITTGATASGGSTENDNIIDTGSNQGTVTVNYNMYYVPDSLDIYYGIFGQGGVKIASTGGRVSGIGSLTAAYGPGASTDVEIIMNQGGGSSGTVWTYTATVVPTSQSFAAGSLVKLGSQLLVIQGDGTYSGGVEVKEGALLNQNDTGLGLGGGAASTTTVDSGAALLLGNTNPANNGGLTRGIQVNGDHLVVNASPEVQQVSVSGFSGSTFNMTFNGQTTGSLPFNATAAQVASALNGLSTIGGRNGSVTVTQSPISEIQQIAVSGLSGSFTLSFNGATTPSLPFNATAAQIQTALANLPTIGAGNVSVTFSGGVFHVSFIGALNGAEQPFIIANASGGATVAVSEQQTGGIAYKITFGGQLGTFNQPTITTSTTGGAIATVTTITSGVGSTSLGIPLAPVSVISADGVATVAGSDPSLGPTNIQWNGPTTLNGTTSVEVFPNSALTLGGNIDDTSSTGSDLIKVGDGELILNGTNSYKGTTYVGTGATVDPEGANEFYNNSPTTPVDGGVVTVGNSQGLGNSGLGEVMTVTVTAGAGGTFTLTFEGKTTTPLPVGATAAAVQAALNALSTITGVGGSTVVTSGAPNVYTVSFTGSLIGFPLPVMTATGATVTIATPGQGGTIVQSGSSLQLQQGVNVAAEQLQIAGSGTSVATTPAVPPTWFSVGPAPILGGQTAGQNAVTGRVTGVATDPTDTNVIYISTAGGGAWKTINGGQTWLPIFDTPGGLFGGSIAVAPSNPSVIYFGTGEADGSLDSYSGTGVYRSTDAGHTWTLLTDAKNGNPILGRSVSKIVVDPFDPMVPFVATSDLPAVLAGNGTGQFGNAGVWRFDSQGWVNMTATVSPVRQGQLPPGATGFPTTAVNTPGPDDDWNVVFPSSHANYTDLAIAVIPANFLQGQKFILYAALGTDDLSAGAAQSQAEERFNAVYRSENPTATTPAWYVGGANQGTLGGYPNHATYSGGAGEFPMNYSATVSSGFPPTLPGQWRNGDLKITVAVTNFNPIFVPTPVVPNPPPLYQQALDGIVIYVSNEYPLPLPNGYPNPPFFELREIDKSQYAGPTAGSNSGGGQQWTTTSTVPTVNGDTVLSQQGFYDNAIVEIPTVIVTPQNFVSDATPNPNANTIYIAGVAKNQGGGPGGFTGAVYTSVDGGTTFTDVSVDAFGNGPHTDHHGLVLTGNGYVNPQVINVNDGGVWRLNPNGNVWTDINGNLAITTMNSISEDPMIANLIVSGSQDNGVQIYNGNNAWNWINFGDGGVARVNPINPNIIYSNHNGILFKSTAGAASNPNTFFPTFYTDQLYFPFEIDQLNPNRIIIGIGADLDNKDNNPFDEQDRNPDDWPLWESVNGGGNAFDGGASWINIGASMVHAGTFQGLGSGDVTSIAIAQFQGTFQTDPGFPQVTDIGANTYDSGTIYVTDGFVIEVTKNNGLSWALRNLPQNLQNGFSISSVNVDPRNRDHVFATIGMPNGSHVFESTNAGQSWTDISRNLPNVPAWTTAIDPRTGTIYVGTDTGLYVSAGGTSNWVQEAGFPQVKVTELFLNQGLNFIDAATYGRSAFRLSLDTPTANSGAINVLSGQAVWNGPIILTGPTSFGAEGTQVLQNGVSLASLTVVGSISDSVAGAGNKVTKIGDGNVIFSGSDTYSGVTEIAQGALIVQNPNALSGASTVVDSGAVLKLESSVLNNEPLVLNGDGVQPPFNGHNSGALENFSNNNTYTGPITLNTNATIGVDSGTTLTVTGVISGGATQTLTKELPGTLALNAANTYAGGTIINQGAIQVENGQALGAANNNTRVLDGAQLQIQTPAGGAPVVVGSGNLSLSGSGIHGTGALLNTGGNNTWAGTISLDSNPSFSPATLPSGVVAFGVANAGDTLTISGVISDSLEASGLQKVGPGELILSGTNTYTGTTYISSGLVDLENNKGLGSANNTAIQRVNVIGSSTGSFTLTFSGQTTQPIPYAAPASGAGSVQAALSALPNIGNGNVSVTQAVATTLTPTGSNLTYVYTVTFTGKLAGVPVALMTAAGISGVTASVSDVADGGIGTLVASGAALGLDLANAASQTVNGEALQLNGNGMARATALNGGIDTNSGALDNISGNNTWTGAPVTFNTSSSIGVDAGSLTISGGLQGLPAAAFNKVGTGTLSLPTANTYQGTTNVLDGILNIGNGNALGGPLTSNEQLVTITGATTGTFTLTINGQTTQPIPANATAAQVQSALSSLSTIGAGNVVVTQSGTTYTVDFTGKLAGVHVNTMTASASAGTTATVTLVHDGGQGGTVVSNGATLQMSGGIVESNNEPLTLSGNGYNGIGALDSASGTNTWSAPILLAANTSIGAEAGATLNLNQTISEAAAGTNLTKVGPGTAILSGNTPEAFTGLVTVNAGTLQLNKSGVLAIPNNLVVGDGTDVAVAQLLANNQIAPTATVTVNNHGTFNVNNLSQTLATLNIIDGTATTGAGATGSLTVTNLNMTSGTVATGAAGSSLNVAGPVVATPDGTNGAARITGNGTVNLGSSPRTFTVNNGPVPSVGLDVATTITGSVNLTKAGNGIMELDADNTGTFTGQLLDNAGSVQVDGKFGEINVNGGGVSGTGNVGSLDNGSPGTAPQGVINPGDNASALPTGILTMTATSVANPSGTENWNAGTTFAVDLANSAAGPGAGYDQLVVNGGTLNLGAPGNQAVLGATASSLGAGSVGPNVAVGDSFTIIQAVGGGKITGTFASPFSPNVVFIAGQKFTVQYTPTTVVITRAKNTATLTVTSSANPSQYGQDVVFTATVTPEPGAGNVPTSDTVTFTFQTTGNNTVFLTQNLNANGQATFDPAAFTGQPISVGLHNLSVTFDGDASYNSTAPVQLTQEVDSAQTNITLSGPTAPLVYGQDATISANVAAKAPGGGVPTGTVIFNVDGTDQPGITLDAGGNAQMNLSSIAGFPLSIGGHRITARYVPPTGNNNYLASQTGSNFVVTVNKDSSLVNVNASVTSGTSGQPVTFTATVQAAAPGTGLATGVVTFYDGQVGSAIIGSGTLDSNGVAKITTSSLANGTHTITALYNGDSHFTTGQGSMTFVVNTVGTSVAVTSSANPALYGSTVVFTATVSSTPPGTGTPNGTVAFVIDNGSPIAVALNSSGQATFTTTSLTVGSHTVVVSYGGAANFAKSTSAPFTENIRSFTNTTVSASGPTVFGQNVTFTATVTSTAPSNTPPNGAVQFVIDGVPQPGVAMDSTGKATFTTNTIGAGNHSIVANYSGAANFIPSSSSALSYSVGQASTSTVVSESAASQTYGQPVTFTATVTAQPPSTAIPDSTVTFVIDGNPQTPIVLDATGKATLTTSSIGTGNHTITATYNGDTNFAGSQAAQGVSYRVQQATTTTALTTSGNPVIAGTNVTFTATVTAGAPSPGIPNGTVTFTIDGVTAGTGTVDATGKATFTTNSLSVKTHTVVATYQGNANFGGSTSNTINEEVDAAGPTTTTLSSSANPSVYGQPVTFSAVVKANNSAAIPNGSVTFVIDGQSQTPVPLDSTGTATFTTNTLSVGVPHTVVAQYPATTGFGGSSSTQLTQTVNADNTTTTLTSSANPAVFAQPVTFTALVQANGPSTAIPTGQVNFTVDGSTTSVAVDPNTGKATLTLSNLTLGTHTVTASYVGSTNFIGSSANAPLSENVVQAGTSTSLTATPTIGSVGQNVTFKAVVTATSPSAGVPTGTVQFVIDGSNFGAPVTLDSTGTAQLTTNSLSKGTHTVVANYVSDTGNYSNSSSSTLNEVVKFGSITTLSSTLSGSAFGQSVSFTATVAGAPGSSGQPTGSVTFIIDGVAQTPIALNGAGQATLTTSTLSSGTHTIQAVYNDDANFAPSSSTVKSFTVNLGQTTTTVTSTSPTSFFGQAVTFIANIAPVSPAQGVPTGQVVFIIDGTAQPAVTLVNGQASFTTSTLSQGLHNVLAVYLGNNNFLASNNTANLVLQQVTSPPPVSLTPSILTNQGIQPGQVFSIAVEAVDAFGNQATSYNTPWAITLLNGPAGGTFQVTAATQFINGIAFANLILTKPGTYTLRISAGGLFTDLTITTLGRQT